MVQCMNEPPLSEFIPMFFNDPKVLVLYVAIGYQQCHDFSLPQKKLG